MLSIIDTPRKTRDFSAYDFEWIPGTLKIRVCGLYDGHEFLHFDNINSFLNTVLSHQNRGRWFYAHAGGLADIQFILEKIVDDKTYSVDAAFSGSSAIIVNIKRGKNTWHFIDSYWLLRDSMKNIGKSLGMHKTGPAEEIEQTTEEVKEWYRSVPLETLIPYCEQDCKILWHAINKFENSIIEMGGQLQKTIAATAMHLFRRKYLSSDIRTSQAINKISRESYFASRVEVFNKHCKNAYYYDINSSYPYAMLQDLPGAIKKSLNNNIDLDVPYVSQVDITIPQDYFPPIPTRRKGRLFFPVGSWKSWLTNIDIDLLRKCGGTINKVYETVSFQPFNDLAHYSRDLYERRKNCTYPFDRLVYKYLLNSLYGKFAETGEKQSMHLNPDAEKLFKFNEIMTDQNDPTIEDSKNSVRMFMPGVWLETKVVNIEHMHVPIASHITAIARRNLFNHMNKGKNFHYCDTDGFSTTDKYDTSNELGDLKLEKLITEGHFVAPKVYRIDGVIDGKKDTIVKAKGFSLGKDKKEAIKRFDDVINKREVEIERMVRIRENLRNNTFEPTEKIIKKVFTQTALPKRYFYANGSSRPWNIKELNNQLT